MSNWIKRDAQHKRFIKKEDLMTPLDFKINTRPKSREHLCKHKLIKRKTLKESLNKVKSSNKLISNTSNSNSYMSSSKSSSESSSESLSGSPIKESKSSIEKRKPISYSLSSSSSDSCSSNYPRKKTKVELEIIKSFVRQNLESAQFDFKEKSNTISYTFCIPSINMKYSICANYNSCVTSIQIFID